MESRVAPWGSARRPTTHDASSLQQFSAATESRAAEVVGGEQAASPEETRWLCPTERASWTSFTRDYAQERAQLQRLLQPVRVTSAVAKAPTASSASSSRLLSPGRAGHSAGGSVASSSTTVVPPSLSARSNTIIAPPTLSARSGGHLSPALSASATRLFASTPCGGGAAAGPGPRPLSARLSRPAVDDRGPVTSLPGYPERSADSPARVGGGWRYEPQGERTSGASLCGGASSSTPCPVAVRRALDALEDRLTMQLKRVQERASAAVAKTERQQSATLQLVTSHESVQTRLEYRVCELTGSVKGLSDEASRQAGGTSVKEGWRQADAKRATGSEGSGASLELVPELRRQWDEVNGAVSQSKAAHAAVDNSRQRLGQQVARLECLIDSQSARLEEAARAISDLKDRRSENVEIPGGTERLTEQLVQWIPEQLADRLVDLEHRVAELARWLERVVADSDGEYGWRAKLSRFDVRLDGVRSEVESQQAHHAKVGDRIRRDCEARIEQLRKTFCGADDFRQEQEARLENFGRRVEITEQTARELRIAVAEAFGQLSSLDLVESSLGVTRRALVEAGAEKTNKSSVAQCSAGTLSETNNGSGDLGRDGGGGEATASERSRLSVATVAMSPRASVVTESDDEMPNTPLDLLPMRMSPRICQAHVQGLEVQVFEFRSQLEGIECQMAELRGLWQPELALTPPPSLLAAEQVGPENFFEPMQSEPDGLKAQFGGPVGCFGGEHEDRHHGEEVQEDAEG